MTNSVEPKLSVSPRSRRPRLGTIILAPLLAFLALSAWAFASPVASSPDDDFHLVSIWCADGGSEYCQPGEAPSNRLVNSDLLELQCFAYDENASAGCQESILTDASEETLTRRGNFAGNYPPLYYSTMHVFAGDDILASAMVMRIVNILLFVGLSTALFLLLPIKRRPILLWGWLVTLVPLGIFLVTSNNPSGWAVTAVGSSWLALLGYFETEGRRRIALGGVFLLSVLMAAGARSDAAFFVAGGTVTVLVLKAAWERKFLILSILPVVGIAIAALFFLTAGQTASGVEGFGPSPSSSEAGPDAAESLGSGGVLAYNILNLPYLWTGVFGGWGLGWLDTAMPTMVLWAAASAFIVFAFLGLAVMSKRKAIAAGGTALILVVLPLYVLWKSNAPVGHHLQARYILPLIVILAFVLLYEPVGRRFRLGRVQRLAIVVALSLANFIALQVNIRRYVTGVDSPGLSLDTDAEWWWSGVPVSPNAVWLVGSLVFLALVVILSREASKTAARVEA